MNWAATTWFVLMLAFLVVEAACPIHLVSVWFAAGAVIAAIVAMLGGDLWLQVTLFVVISGGLLLALWPFVKKFLNPRHSATNLDSVIGSEGYVITAIDNHSAVGQVKLGGMEWSARSTNGKPVEVGTLVKVDRIEGVKVYVSAVEAEVTV